MKGAPHSIGWPLPCVPRSRSTVAVRAEESTIVAAKLSAGLAAELVAEARDRSRKFYHFFGGHRDKTPGRQKFYQKKVVELLRSGSGTGAGP